MLRLFLNLLLIAVLPGLAVGQEGRLFRSLIGRSELLRTRTIASLNPERDAEKLSDLIAAAEHFSENVERDDLVPHSTTMLLYLIGQFEHITAEKALVKLLDCEHAGLAMVSADSLGKNQRYGAIAALQQQVNRVEFSESYGFRFNLIRALAQMEHPDAVEFLTELQQQLDGQLRYQLQCVLDEVNVHHFFGDEERFKAWQARDEKPEPARESFFTASSQPDSLNRIAFEKPQYYGIEIHAKRLMFIIDHSGSMKEYWGGYTRLARAKLELVKAIKELPEDTEFAIAFYESSVRMWRDTLVQATEDNKLEAIKFVQKLGYGDRTNTYAALRNSLEFDQELEAVFLLTDGRPTIGQLTAPAQIVPDIIHRNRFRHLNFNTIGIAVQGSTETFLKTLAEQTNGEFRQPDWQQ
ncbi:MAG: VWA domain-containing protein [Rubripirellula sp.]|nr:VWA domain-containing protein [Rubripirellula sp.]